MTGPVEPVADTEAVETISRADLGKAVRWAQYRDWSISDEEHEVVENLADDAWNALTLRPRLVPVENGLIRPVVSSSTREDGEGLTLPPNPFGTSATWADYNWRGIAEDLRRRLDGQSAASVAIDLIADAVERSL